MVRSHGAHYRQTAGSRGWPSAGRRWAILTAVVVLLGSALGSGSSVYAADATTLTGSVDGTAFKIEVPATWNHTLLLYSRWYNRPGTHPIAADSPDFAGAETTGWLLDHGYALAGSSYSNPQSEAAGWAVE